MIAENYGFTWLKIDLPFPCAIHFAYQRKPFNKNVFNVLLIHTEPEEIRTSEEELEKTWQDYDLIISHDARHAKYSNVVISYYWETVITSIPLNKIFDISSMISIGGGPSEMTGYKKREELYIRKHEITTPKTFYISRRLPKWESFGLPPLPDDKKDAMFTSMFHIAIENEIENDYFSEKLLDCFNGFSVPIYRGCTNLIQHGIDERAIIRFNTIDECITICNSLTALDYFNRIKYICNNRNLLLSKSFWQLDVQNICINAWNKRN